MDDFERELSRMMRDSRQQTPFAPESRRRLYRGIRARRRSRLLWKAGGSALAVTGLGIGLALLPATGSRPADHRPLPATSPTPPPASPTPTPSAPSTSHPPTSTPGTTMSGTTAPGYGGTPTSPPPSATTGADSRTATPPTPPVSSLPPTAPPSTGPARGPSASAGHASAGSG
ncbi:cellulase [Streptomyces griseoloalbus]|uniref:Cellulase n=1 Tax=Streptomyces griseoloalbus TaxID=67303 RepID=A0ABV3DZT2_9ACTN